MPVDAAGAGRAARRNIACDECKKRKVRCSAEPQCTNCVKDGKNCTYSSAVHRVSALERKLQRYEGLFETIKSAWAVYVPNVSLQHALETLDNRATQSDAHASRGGPALVDSLAGRSSSGPSAAAAAAVAAASPTSLVSQEDQEQNNPEDFEFDESQEFGDTIDGMGILTLDPFKAGYTGPQSGIAALKVLRSLPAAYPIDDSNGLTQVSSHTFSESGSATTASTLIDDYFQLYHPAYPLLHEGTFRARVSGALAKPRDGSWPLLYNMVLAMGAFAGDTEGSNHDLELFRAARECVSLSVIEKGSLCYVQGLTLMANYLQKRNKPNAGFALVGIAWSMSLAIGLHREFGPTSTTPFSMEIRRRTWWTLYLFVSGAQLTLGRPPASLVGINLHNPANVDDSDLVVDMDVLPESREAPTVASCIIAQIPLGKIANEVQTELLTNHVPDIDAVERLDRGIEVWLATLPTYLNPESDVESRFELPKRILLWRSYHLRIVLNRPFLFQTISQKLDITTRDVRVQRCISTADTCVDDIHRSLCQTGLSKRGFAWYATYWLISASFVHAICYTYAPQSKLASGWSLRIRRAIEVLEKVGFAHSMADRAKRILQNICERFDVSSTATRPTSTELPAYIASNFRSAQQHQDISLQNNNMEWISLQRHLDVPLEIDPGLDTSWPWLPVSDEELMDAAGGTLLQDYQADFQMM